MEFVALSAPEQMELQHEVILLRQRVRDLEMKNGLLESENSMLRALEASRDTVYG